MIYDVSVSLIIFSLSLGKYLFMTYILYFFINNFLSAAYKNEAEEKEYNKRYLFHGRRIIVGD